MLNSGGLDEDRRALLGKGLRGSGVGALDAGAGRRTAESVTLRVLSSPAQRRRPLFCRLGGTRQVMGRVDERDVRERLWIVPDQPVCTVSYSSASSPTSLRNSSNRANNRRASSMRPRRT